MADLVYPAHGPRYQETFPELTPAGNRPIATLRRVAQIFGRGEAVRSRERSAPACSSCSRARSRSPSAMGWATSTPIVEQGAGQFLAEVGQLSSRAALVDGTAEGDVETLLIPPDGLRALLVAEADLGERIMRALILRRVALLQGARGRCPDRAARVGRRDPARGLSDQERLSPPFARSRHGPGSARGDRPLRRYRRRIAAGGLPGRLGARQSVGAGALPQDRHDGRVASELRL